ncbi:glycosyltransferase family 4 protein [Psychroserpens sp. BH13MA-6]
MNKKIRVLFTIPNFDTAGSGKVVYDLAKGLDASKFDVEIACEADTGELFKTVQSLNLPIHIIETKTNYRPYYNLFSRVKKISRFFKEQQYDIIHSWQWSSDWTEALAAKFAGVKWIYTKKAMGFESRHWKIKSRLADYIITINDEMRHYFPNKQQQQLIPLGLDTDYYSPSATFAEVNHTPETFKIITVANLVPVKGIEILIKALNDINDTDIQLDVLGDDTNEYAEKLKALVRELQLEKQVHFLGKKIDVRPDMAHSDLYVIPTLDQGRKEGMPMALVEAMSMGIPLLGSDISGINYVLRDFKELLFEPGNVQQLTERILSIQKMTREKRAQLGTSLRDYCVAHYTVEAFVEAHELLYQELKN